MATPNMGIVEPVEDGSPGVWDTLLNAAFDVLDAHDHSAGKGVKVPIAGLNVNADLPFTSAGIYYAITSLKAIDFQPQAAAGMAALAGALFVNSADNELYWRTTGGVNVKLTAGAIINAALIGGIGGDYAGVSALVDFIDASDSYRMRQQVGGGQQHYAHVSVGDLDLYEFFAHPSGTAVPVNRVRLSSAAALAASYAVTFAGALPGATSAVQISAGGALSYSNTFANAMTFSALATFNLGATLAVNQNVILSGTGTYKHGDRTKAYGPAQGMLAGGGALGNTLYWAAVGVADIVLMQIDLETGKQIKSVTYSHQRAGGAMTFKIWREDMTGGTRVQVGTTITVNAGVAFATSTDAAINHVVVVDNAYYLEWTTGAAADRWYGAKITYDQP